MALDRQQQVDQRLLDIAWRLRTGNASNCVDAAPAIGLTLLDIANYRDSAEVSEALRLGGPIAVQAVAGGSPAYSAGLKRRMTIHAIGAIEAASMPAASSADYARLRNLHEAISAQLARTGSLTLTVQDGRSGRRSVTIEGTPACPGRIEVRDGQDQASADTKRVFIGSEFPGLAYSDEELAAALAHEFAHIWLGHNQLLDQRGRSRLNIREAEREADRLSVWILAHAGYPTDAATRFMRRWGPRNSGGLLRKRTHDVWDERIDLMNREMVNLAHATIIGDNGNWSGMFQRGFSAPE